MHRIPIDGDAYVAARLPHSIVPGRLSDAVRAAALAARGDGGPLPPAIVWDARMHARLGEAVVRLSDGPLDELLLSQIDATGCCAVLESVLNRLRERGAIAAMDRTGEALAILARDPSTRVAHAEGVLGELGPEPLRAGQRRLRPAGPRRRRWRGRAGRAVAADDHQPAPGEVPGRPEGVLVAGRVHDGTVSAPQRPWAGPPAAGARL